MIIFTILSISSFSFYAISEATQNKGSSKNEEGFFRVYDNNTVLYHNAEFANHPTKLEDVDIENFIVLNRYYAKDNSSVYYGSQKIIDADPSTFELFDEAAIESFDDLKFPEEYYFEPLSKYAKDKNYVYKLGKKINDAVPESFLVNEKEARKKIIKDNLYGPYKIEGKSIIYKPGNNIIEESDIADFVYLGNDYAEDKNAVYFRGEKIDMADNTSFQVLSSYYAKDAKNAYWIGEPISIEDIHTFEALDKNYNGITCAKDNKKVYVYNEIYPADTKTFEVFEGFFVKDKDTVAQCFKPIEEADPATFRVNRQGIGRDRFRMYEYNDFNCRWY